MIIKHNKEQFSKVKDTKACKDKTCNSMNENTTRDSIMNGDLNREDCDEEEMYEFLRLLKRPKKLIPDDEDYMQINEWKQVVKKQKKSSTSSTFSRRDYEAFKCALECERMVEVLVQFYNVIIKCNHYPRRWLKVVDVMIEKGKGPRINKLRTLEMIEANLQLVMRMFLGSRMNERIETDARMSKHNYGSRSGHSIKNVLLEKRLMTDHGKNQERQMCALCPI